MKKMTLLVIAFMMLNFVSGLIAQEADTLDVAPGYETLNIAVTGDTLEDGSRKNPNRVYRLERGGQYILNGRITLGGGVDFNLVGASDDGVNPPAMVQPGVQQDGSNDIMFELGGDVTLKNIMFINHDVIGNQGQNNAIRFVKDSAAVIIVDRCYWDYDAGHACLDIKGKNVRLYMTNSYMKNMYFANAWWRGRGMFFNHQPIDTVVIENNTFAGVGGFVFQVRKNFCDYFWFNHNTIYLCGKMPFCMERWTHCVLSNNLIVNAHAAGETMADRKGQDVDGQLYGIFNTDTLESYNAPIATEDAFVLLANNANYRDSEFDDYYASTMVAGGDSVQGQPFMNERTQGLFDNLDNFKLINLKNADPELANPPDYTDNYIQWLIDKRSSAAEKTDWKWDPDGEIGTITWPLPEDYAYTNADFINGGTDGLPLGDLNWFPDGLADFEANKDQYRQSVLDAAEPPKELVAHWTFDETEGTTAADASGNGLDGTLIGGTWTEGKVNGGLQLDGVADYVNVPDNDLLDISEKITITAWIMVTDTTGKRNLLQKKTNYALFEMKTGEAAPKNVFKDASAWQSVPYEQEKAAFLNNWVHVAMTFDGTTLTNYVNGEVSGSADFAGSVMAVNDEPLGIGTNSPWNNSFFAGIVDDIRIYNYALAADEIAAMYVETDVADNIPAKSDKFILNQNYPNPFNPQTTINYTIEKAGKVDLTVYNVQGQNVRTLVDNNQEAGRHSVIWNGQNDSGISMPSGIYYYQIKTSQNTKTMKMLLIK